MLQIKTNKYFCRSVKSTGDYLFGLARCCLFRLSIVATDRPSERRPERRLIVTGDSARIQDETIESSTLFFNMLGV